MRWLAALVPCVACSSGFANELAPKLVARIGSQHWEMGSSISGLALSPKGSLAAVSSQYAAHVARVPSGEVVFRLPLALRYSRALTFSSDGKWLLDGGADQHHVVFWDVAKKKEHKRIRIHKHPTNPRSIALSPDGRILAVYYDYYPRPGTVDTGLAIFDMATRKTLFQRDSWRRMSAFDFKKNGDRFDVRIVTAGSPHYLFDTKTQKLSELKGIVKTILLAASGGRTVHSERIYQMGSGRWKFRRSKRAIIFPHREFGGLHGEPGWVAISADGRRIAVGGTLGAVHIWDFASGRRLDADRFHLMGVAARFSRDGKHIWTWERGIDLFVPRKPTIPTKRKRVRSWNAHTGQAAVEQMIAAPFVASTRGAIQVEQSWDTIVVKDKNGIVRKIPFCPQAANRSSFAPLMYRAMASPDGKLVAATGRFNSDANGKKTNLGPRIEIWDAGTGKSVASYVEKKRFTKSPVACFSPDSSLVAVAFANWVRVLDARTGKVLATLKTHRGIVRSVAFSPDGKRLATAGDDNCCLVWRLKK